jgi:Zn2+/Cd2+-exporting ATPase
MVWLGDTKRQLPVPCESHKGTRDLEASFLPKSKLRGPIEVGFVGDGLNDCPALASAHVGIVLQEIGSQATVDAASAVLQVDIDQLPAAIVIARRSRLLLITNICLALAMNVLIVLLAATVGLPLWLSVLSDSGSLLVILANSLWPLTWRVGKDARRQRSNS